MTADFMLRKMLFIAVFMKNINLFQAIFEQKYLHDLKLFEVSSKSESIKLSGDKMKDTNSMFNLKKCYSFSKPDTVQTLHLKNKLICKVLSKARKTGTQAGAYALICTAFCEDNTYWQWPQRS